MDARRMLARFPTCGLFAAAMLAMSMSTHTQAAAPEPNPPFNASPLPSFTAEVVMLAPGSDEVMDRSRLEFSPRGMRMIRRSGADRQILLRNFSTGQAWLVDPRRAVQHELRFVAPVTESPGNDAESAESNVTPVSDERESALTNGLLSPLPCLQYPRLEALPIERWRGQAVSAWGCLSASGKRVGIDYFSDALGLVIRSELVGIAIEELRSITALEFPSGHFTIRPDHVPVSLDELINGARVQSRKYE